MKSQTRVPTAPLMMRVFPCAPTSLPGILPVTLLRPDPALGDNFWAPEVAYCDGKFYLYYVGHEDKIISCALPPAIARIRTSDRRC